MVRFRPEAPNADLAHLVERHLAKVEVASSSLVIRSKKVLTMSKDFIIYCGFISITRILFFLKGDGGATPLTRSSNALLFSRAIFYACVLAEVLQSA